jgi:hypothetical protein
VSINGKALRCADPTGSVVQFLATHFGDPAGVSRLGTVRGGALDTTWLRGPRAANALAVPEGFLAYGPSDPALIRPDGTVRRLPKIDVPGGIGRLRLAPDGRTAAVTSLGSYDRRSGARTSPQVLLIDLTTGQVHARWQPPDPLDGLEWTSSGRLLARVGYSNGLSQPQNVGHVLELDGSLRVVGERPGAPGSSFTAVGDTVVFWEGARMSVVTGQNSRTVSDLRLSAAWEMLALPDAVGEATRTAGLGKPVPSTDPAVRGVMAATVAAALVAMVLAGFARRTRR